MSGKAPSFPNLKGVNHQDENILGILLMMGLVFLGSAGTLGAVRSSGERFPTDTWYSVTPQESYWQLFCNKYTHHDTYFTGGELYQNDQTFLQVYSGNVYGIFENMGLAASYLFDSGFFIGLSDLKMNGSNQTTISPGYRFSLNENSYAALSLDYTSALNTNKVTGYELDLQYYLDNAKLRARIYNPVSGDNTVDVGIAYAFSKLFVAGCDYENQYDSVTIGFTYTVLPVIFDYKYYYSNVDEYGYNNLRGMFKLGEDYGIGLQYYQFLDDDNPRYTLTFKYKAANGDFKVLFTPENGNVDQSYSLAYYKAL